MSIQHVLVYVNSEKTVAVNTAFKLAKQHNAVLTALFVVPLIKPPVMLTYVPDAETIASQRQEGRDRGAKIKQDLKVLADKAEVAFNFVIEEGYTFDCIVDAARYADVTVLSKDEPGVGLVLIQDLLYSSGHPVLVVPESADDVETGHRIVIAWKANAAAVRAVSAAIPLLQKASEITVAEVIEDDAPVGRRSGHKLTEHLNRHGISAVHEVFDNHDDTVGLLKACELANADLLVMGGFAHSRAREWILGGVTRYMLTETPLALFVMH